MRSLKNSGDVKKFAKQMGLHQDETNLKNLKIFIDLFSPENYEVQILPAATGSAPTFRSLLKKDYLRISPDRLRMLYGTRTQSQWTLVGSVTLISGDEESAAAVPEQTQRPTTPGSGPALSMREPFNQLFNALAVMEQAFVASLGAKEINVMPLAIYRDLRH